MSFLRLLGLVGLSAFFVGCGAETPVTPGSALWARRFGRDNYVAPVGLAGVASGGVIVAGKHYGDIDLGGGMLPGPSNNYQAYVARYDGEGNHIYSRSFGAEFAEGATDVAALPDGSALVAGTFRWPVDLDGISLPWDGKDDAFVAKLDPAGKVVWARAFGGAGDQRPIAIAAMPDGGAVLAGSTMGEVDLGIGEPQSSSYADFLVRLDPEGTPSWVRTPESEVGGIVSTRDVAVRGDVVAVVGRSREPGGFDYVDGFVATYDLQGNPLWDRAVGSLGYSNEATAVAFTDDGGLVLTGQVKGYVDFGEGASTGTDQDNPNTYLLELDANSKYRRSAIYGGSGDDSGLGIATTSDGSVILTGRMTKRMSFGMADLVGSEDEVLGDAFVAELDADRNPVFLRRFGGTELQWGQAAAVDGQGRVYIAGTAVGAVDFGLGPTEASGYYETFLVALAP